MPGADAHPVTASEAKSLFSDLTSIGVLVLAVSGGPDSTALMVLAARWRDAFKVKPKLVAVTVDHGLRKEAKAEAASVARLARKLKLPHRILRWRGRKPATGLPQAARAARYALLADVARLVGATHILTAHTLDDQAETVLIRMSRGSGISGLGAMQRISVIPGHAESAGPKSRVKKQGLSLGNGFRARSPRSRHEMAVERDALHLVRPLLDIPKSRLVATLRAAKIPFADDPSNRDPRFTRARLRPLMPQLAAEGLDARRFGALARRLRRADQALEAATDQAGRSLMVEMTGGRLVMEARRYVELPAEIALRLLGRAIDRLGNEGPAELAKLEALAEALRVARNTDNGHLRRSLAGALITCAGGQIVFETAPPRRAKSLTTDRGRRAKRDKPR